MDFEKDLLASKTFWGTIIAAVAMLAQLFGVDLNTDGLANQIATFVGLIFALYGRVKADTRITSVAGVKSSK